MKKRLLAILLGLCVVLGLIPAMTPSAQAYSTGDDYPQQYKDADYDWCATNWTNPAAADEWNFVKRQCTSFVAHCLNSRNGIDFDNWYGGVRWSHGGNWGNAARSCGIPVDNTPAVGAVAYWENGGHVAWVREVNGDTVVIEEYNYTGYKLPGGCWNEDTLPTRRNGVSDAPTGYIHIADIAQPLEGEDFTKSSWFGQYTGYTSGGSIYVERYIDFTIDNCDSTGKFSGSAKVTTVEGQGYDYQWVNYKMAGRIDFDTNTFQMQGTKITSYNSGSNWSLALFKGAIQVEKTGDMTISGIADNTDDRVFSFSRTSAWARDEMTEANILGLIPKTLKGADMSKKITRAEFAAVAVQLYESLKGGAAASASTNFTDIAGNVNEENIKKAYYLGFTAGITDNTFAPNTQITREQLATMLCRVIKKYSFAGWTLATDNQYYLDTFGAPVFEDDADISAFAKPSVYYMAKMGIIKGVDSTHFAPKSITTEQEVAGYATATREQAVALSLRVYKMSDVWG